MRRWSRKDLQILLRTIVRHAREGKTRDMAFEKASQLLHRSKGTVAAKFYNLFKNIGKADRESLLESYGRGEVSLAGMLRYLEGRPPNGQRRPRWSRQEETILVSEVLAALREGRTKQSAFRAAARKIGRTPAACTMRYLTHITPQLGNPESPEQEEAQLQKWLDTRGVELPAARAFSEPSLFPADGSGIPGPAANAVAETHKLEELECRLAEMSQRLRVLEERMLLGADARLAPPREERLLEQIRDSLRDIERALSLQSSRAFRAADIDGWETRERQPEG